MDPADDSADRQLIDEVTALTGAAPPHWADEAAPTLQSRQDDSIYLIGVIGGKDVGKSSLINALLEQPIAAVSAHGEGTAKALAFVHESDVSAARAILEREAAGRFEIVTHTIAHARRRVLLDLPDIDSVWTTHADVTRRLLRHMLFPVWVQSVEKYADAQPLQMLAKVAAGNSAENFLFVVTKADQLARRHGDDAVADLTQDYGRRVARACGLEQPPRVFAVNSVAGSDEEAFDLDALRSTVLAERSTTSLVHARRLARRQQKRTLKNWLLQQRVDDRLSAAKRLLDEAESLVLSRLSEPMVDQVTRRLATDATTRGSVIEPAVRSRLSYWPIVNVLDAVLGPALSAIRSRGGEAWTDQPIAGRDLGQHIRGVFADLVQRDPMLLELHANEKLWEQNIAQQEAGVLQQRLASAIDAHRISLQKTLGKPSILTRIIAPVLTIGVALWFPIVQPVLEIVLQRDIVAMTRETVLTIVNVLGANYLIQSVGLLAIYFVALWLWLRWMAYRRIDRALAHATDARHPAAVVLAWTDSLLMPLRLHVEKLQSLSDRIAGLGDDDRAAA